MYKIYCKNCKHFRKPSIFEGETWDEKICHYRIKTKYEGKVDEVTGIKSKSYTSQEYPFYHQDMNMYNCHNYMNIKNECKYFKPKFIYKLIGGKV